METFSHIKKKMHKDLSVLCGTYEKKTTAILLLMYDIPAEVFRGCQIDDACYKKSALSCLEFKLSLRLLFFLY